MKHYLSLHLEAAKTALLSLFRQPVGSLLILVMLGIALTLPLVLYLGIQSSQSVLGKLNEAPQITVFMEPAADTVDVNAVAAKLQQDTRFKKVQFVSKAQALQDLQAGMGEQDLVSMLDDNPLPDAFVLTPASTDPATIKALQAEVAQLPLVETSSVDTEWMQTLFQINRFVRQVVWFLAVTLCVAFVLVAHNTIRLQILAQKEAIEITKLLGAPSSFVRRPFLYQAWWQGMLAVGLSLGLCAWLIEQTRPMLSQMFAPYGINLAWRFFSAPELAVIVLLMSLLAVAGAWLATHQHLHAFRARS